MAGRFIYVPCMQCNNMQHTTYYKIFNHNNQYEHITFTCNKGHMNIIKIQELAFETLLHIAFENFINLYYRESVFNFAAAQERLFEFIIRVLCCEQNKKYKNYELLWNIIQNQSERQLGAFCSLYFQRFGYLPFEKKGFEKNAQIRNEVVHKGKSPKAGEARKYGEFIIRNLYNIMKDILENIDNNIVHEVRMQLIDEHFKKRGLIPKRHSCISVSTSIVSWTLQNESEIENNKRLNNYSKLHPYEYSEKASEANNSNKILYIPDSGNLELVSTDFFQQRPEKRIYRGGKTFDDYLKAAKNINNSKRHCSQLTS